MKKLLILLAIIGLLSSCSVDSINNYSNGVVVDKYTQLYRSGTYDYVYLIDKIYNNEHKIVKVYLTSYQYNMYNIGDTIK